MTKDEEAIREYYSNWMKATKEGDLELARSLIQKEAVFYVPGGYKMDKEAFAQAATAENDDVEFELDCSIEEIRVIGDHAWLCTKLSLTMTEKKSRNRTVMAGHALSILQKEDGEWAVLREANTMIAVGDED